jgi:hypothetical protein
MDAQKMRTSLDTHKNMAQVKGRRFQPALYIFAKAQYCDFNEQAPGRAHDE